MAHLTYYSYPGYGEVAKTELNYSQAVRIGDIIEISGQGGWDRADANLELDYDDAQGQYERAFENVQETLKLAGGKGWSEVFSVRSYHVGFQEDKHIAMFVALMKKYCPDHQPLWTLVPVPALGKNTMRIEIEVRAHVQG